MEDRTRSEGWDDEGGQVETQHQFPLPPPIMYTSESHITIYIHDAVTSQPTITNSYLKSYTDRHNGQEKSADPKSDSMSQVRSQPARCDPEMSDMSARDM